MFRLILAIIPTTIFLTVRFFVLAVVRKIESQGLTAFGYVVAALLWASALLIFSVGIYSISSGRPNFTGLKKMMARGMMSCPMMQGKLDLMGKDMAGCPMMREKMKEGVKTDMPGMKHQ